MKNKYKIGDKFIVLRWGFPNSFLLEDDIVIYKGHEELFMMDWIFSPRFNKTFLMDVEQRLKDGTLKVMEDDFEDSNFEEWIEE